jgi:hypothetical protein
MFYCLVCHFFYLSAILVAFREFVLFKGLTTDLDLILGIYSRLDLLFDVSLINKFAVLRTYFIIRFIYFEFNFKYNKLPKFKFGIIEFYINQTNSSKIKTY